MLQSKLTAAQRTFLIGVSDDRLAAAELAATMVVRGDQRFVGLDKIRAPIIAAATLNGLGCERNVDFLNSPAITQAGLYDEVSALLEKAETAVREKMAKVAA